MRLSVFPLGEHRAMTSFDSMETQHLQGCGALLREARTKAGMSLQDVATRLKMPSRVLQSLEQEEWQALGAPVFVRGQLRSYARLLKVDIEEYLQQAHLDVVKPVELVSRSHTSGLERFLDTLKRRAVYIVITLGLVIPVWMGARSHLGAPAIQQTASLDVLPDQSSSVGGGEPSATRTEKPAIPATNKPYTASMVPSMAAASSPALRLSFNGESWVQINAPDGSRLQQALMKPGDSLSYQAGQVGRVVLGNASAVEVQQGGSTVDTVPFQRANVARFTVSSDGSLAPVND